MGAWRERRSSIMLLHGAPVVARRINPTRGNAATNANGGQDEQDLQDGFGPRPTGVIDSVQLNPVTSFILSILFILSKNQVSI
jgi:hypothetical protein